MNDYIDEDEYVLPIRTEAEMVAAIDRLVSQVWYNRHKYLSHKDTPEEIWQQAEAAAKEVERDIDDLGPWTDFKWGMINGKLSALRWVLGDEWDMLDT